MLSLWHLVRNNVNSNCIRFQKALGFSKDCFDNNTNKPQTQDLQSESMHSSLKFRTLSLQTTSNCCLQKATLMVDPDFKGSGLQGESVLFLTSCLLFKQQSSSRPLLLQLIIQLDLHTLALPKKKTQQSSLNYHHYTHSPHRPTLL